MTQLTLRTLGLPEFSRHAIGFDRLFNEMEKTFANTRTDRKSTRLNSSHT